MQAALCWVLYYAYINYILHILRTYYVMLYCNNNVIFPVLKKLTFQVEKHLVYKERTRRREK
jgi:hypothetical protein